MSEGISSGVASAVGRAGKDEDRHLKSEGVYGVFDGHGGRGAAELCSREFEAKVRERLCSSVSVAEAARGAFWEFDKRLIDDQLPSGTTALFCWIDGQQSFGEEEKQPTVSSCVTLGWIGDSEAVRVDMLGKGITYKTRKHTPEDADEKEMINAVWTCRRELEESDEDLESFARRRQVELLGAKGRSGLLGDALKRSINIDAAIGAHPLERRQTVIGRRCCPVTKKPTGQNVVVSAGYNLGDKSLETRNATIQMTRSVGDVDVSRSVLPELEHVEWAVDPDAYDRLVMATDGLWDHVSHDEVARLVAQDISPQEAADLLLNAALKKGNHNDYHADDTTIVVVDINPSGLRCVPQQKKKKAACVCM